MKTLPRVFMGILVFTLSIFCIGFVAGEVISQKKIDLIKQRIPNQWWYGGWNEENNCKDIISNSQENEDQKAEAQYYIACQHYANNDHQVAIQEFRKLLEMYPKAWFQCQKAQFEIGQICLYRLEDPANAIFEYQRAIDNYQESYIKPLAQVMIGRAYRKQKQYDTALSEYEKVSLLYPAYLTEVTQSHIDIAGMLTEQAFGKVNKEAKARYLNDALTAYKSAYMQCPVNHPELMEQILDGIGRTFRCLDMNLVRADQFIKFQKYGQAGLDGTLNTDDDLANPLEEI